MIIVNAHFNENSLFKLKRTKETSKLNPKGFLCNYNTRVGIATFEEVLIFLLLLYLGATDNL